MFWVARATWAVCDDARSVPKISFAELLLQRILFVFVLVSSGTVPFLMGLAVADQPPSTGYTRDYVEEVLNESVNANTLFSSQDLISNGRFLQRRINQPDTQYETFRVPAEIVLGDRTNSVRPFLRSGLGVLKVTGGAASFDGQGENDFSVTTLLTFLSGFGVYIDVGRGWSVVPAITVSYSHLRNAYDFNNPYSQEVLKRDYGEYYNWGLDLFTYAPQMRIVQEQSFATGLFRYTLSATQLFNDSFHGSSANVKINSSSGLVSNRLEFQQDLGLHVGSAAIALQPFFQWSNISGKAASGLNFVNMYEVGADFIFTLREKFGPLSAVYVGASYVSADSFEGYHIGLGGRF